MVHAFPEGPAIQVEPAGRSRAAGAARGRLLILNHGLGVRRPHALYRELAALGWETRVVDMEEPALLRRWALARSFHPSLARWRRRFQRTTNRLCRTVFAFKYRSWLCGRLIGKVGATYDLILQGSGMFAPGWPRSAPRYAVACDCTVRLGDGEPLSGVDFASPAAAAKWYALEGMLYRNARYVFPLSQYVSRSLVEHYGVDPARAIAIGGGLNIEAADAPERPSDAKTLLYVGYDFERKGGKVLLAAFERVAAEMPDAELVIAGPRHLPDPLPRGVRMVGPASPQKLSELYSRATLFVMPSLFEPFGLVFLDAMEHKLPCIGSNRGAIPEIIVDGETGLIVPAGDAQALAESIIYLLRRPHTMRLMGERGRERVRALFTWRAVAERIDARLVELL